MQASYGETLMRITRKETDMKTKFAVNSLQASLIGLSLVCFHPVSVSGQTPIANMVWILPGTFVMGSPDAEVDRYSNEGPQTTVTLTKGFWMGKYEVTQGEYVALMGNNPSSFTGDLNRPVENMSWDDAVAYCAALTERERGAGRITASYQYRLPTEAEWEYACRAATTTRFSYGDDPGYALLPNYAWYDANSGGTTHPVGQKLPNPWGLYDMYGTVVEWCQDWYGYSLPGGSVTDPQGPATGVGRVIRGGDWNNGARNCRSALRGGAPADGRYGNFGFRVVLAPALVITTQPQVICGGDDFNDNAKNVELWGTDLVFNPGGTLVETNGRLEFRGTGAVGWPYVWSYRSYSQNWEVITDVSVGSVPLNQPASHVQMSLNVANRDDTNLMNGIPGDHFSIALDLYRSSDGQIERSFEAYFRTDWNELLPRGDAVTTSQQASVRVTFDATTKTLTAWYDGDGSAGGYTWTALRSVPVNAAGSDWQMSSNSTFVVSVGASSALFDVTSSHLVYADNFGVCDDLAPPRLLLTKSGNTPQVTIQGSSGTHLEIQFAGAVFTNASWLELTNLVLTNNSQTVSDPSATGVPTRYYRAKLKP